jgi:hypothetical protein
VRTSHHIVVPVGASEVFAYLSDVRNEIHWRESVVGSRYIDADAPAVGVDGETIAEMGSQGVTMRWVISEFEPGEFVAWTLDGEPWRGGGSYRVTPMPEGSRIEAALTVRVKPHLRILEPVLWFAFRKGLRGDLARLGGILTSPR